jgi:hypothetical protein
MPFDQDLNLMQIRKREFYGKTLSIKKIVVEKSDVMGPFGKLRHRWKDYIKFYVEGRENDSVG